MNIIYSGVYIYPYLTDESDGIRLHAYACGEDDSRVEGWNVHSFGLINGTAGIIDDIDFPNCDTAYAFATKFAEWHSVDLVWGMA